MFGNFVFFVSAYSFADILYHHLNTDFLCTVLDGRDKKLKATRDQDIHFCKINTFS